MPPPSAAQRPKKQWGAAEQTTAPPVWLFSPAYSVVSSLQNSLVRLISTGLASPGMCLPFLWLKMRCAASRFA